MNARRLLAVMAVLMMISVPLSADKVPRELEARFVTGDPIWRELPVREDFQKNYDRVWQTAVNTILEHNFDIATMDKESGYFRTIPNEKVVRMNGYWTYKVQISVKIVTTTGDPHANPPVLPVVEKVRLQVTGEVIGVDRMGRLRHNFRGYDQVLLQSMFQDLQAKLGSS